VCVGVSGVIVGDVVVVVVVAVVVGGVVVVVRVCVCVFVVVVCGSAGRHVLHRVSTSTMACLRSHIG
jgi:hypothetical protein